jgi:hypothetical protein
MLPTDSLTLVETSSPKGRRDITAIVADFKAAEKALNKYERQIETARERADQRRLEMARLLWEARQWWEAAKADGDEIAGWSQFAEAQFGKSRAEIDRLLKVGKADDPAKQLRADRERDRERKRATTTQVVPETPNSETHLGDIADGPEPVASATSSATCGPTWAASLIGVVGHETSSEQVTDERRSLILDDIARMLLLSRHPADDIRDIVSRFVDARVDEIPEPAREELVRYCAEVMEVAIPLESAPPQEVADAAD